MSAPAAAAGGGAWLPALIELRSCGGVWADYVEVLYGHFRDDFVLSTPNFPGRRWSLRRHPVELGKESTFWHIVSEGSDETTRTPDLRRCERIRWPRPIIDAYGRPTVRCWRNKRGTQNRVLIATDDFDYVVVLDDRRDYIMLLTAYCVEDGHRRRKLEKEYERFQKTGVV